MLGRGSSGVQHSTGEAKSWVLSGSPQIGRPNGKEIITLSPKQGTELEGEDGTEMPSIALLQGRSRRPDQPVVWGESCLVNCSPDQRPGQEVFLLGQF